MIRCSPADSGIVRDYLRLITLSQGHIINPTLLERIYLGTKRDLRRTLTQLQFWCQFGVGDTRSGAEWINWGGKETDWVMSRGTYLDGVEWRQESLRGEDTVLEAVEVAVPDVDIEEMTFPQLADDLTSPTSIFKQAKSVLTALTGIADFLESMSFLDSTVDRQFTAYEVTPYLSASADDVLSEPRLRSHPGRRFEKPQGVETLWAPSIRIFARHVLEENLEINGYYLAPLTAETITSQPVKDFLHPRLYVQNCLFLLLVVVREIRFVIPWTGCYILRFWKISTTQRSERCILPIR